MSAFLATRVRIPPIPRRTISRPHLTTRLEHGVPEHRLTILSAPSGYGKTTLLVQWSTMSQFDVAWASLTEDEDDVLPFLRLLVAAWEVVSPDLHESDPALMLAAKNPDLAAAEETFIVRASQNTEHLIFVLDNFHTLQDDAVLDLLSRLLQHLPDHVHFVLAGRGEPALPIARFRASDQILEIQTDELRFSTEEHQAFWKTRHELDGETMARLYEESEGWPAGLQLAAFTMEQGVTSAGGLSVTGSNRYVADYLREDVLAHVTAEERAFLLQTSLLDNLCATLCNAVTGRHDSQQMLEALERSGLFLMPLDAKRKWYRYQTVFAEFARKELRTRQPDRLAELHRRATGWFIEHQLPEDAFRHAISTGEADLVEDVMGAFFPRKVLSGEIKTLQRWLKRVPKDWFVPHTMTGLARAATLLYTGQFDACQRLLEKIQSNLLEAGQGAKTEELARLKAFQCFIACENNDLELARTLADEALGTLPSEDHSFRLSIYGALGDTYRRHGLWEEAEQCYKQVLLFREAPDFRIQAAHVYGALADLDLRKGRLRDSFDNWQRALRSIQVGDNWGSYSSPLLGWIDIRLAELYSEWFELERAWEHVSRGLERAEMGGDIRSLIAGHLVAGQVKLSEGDIDGASHYLEKVRTYTETSQFGYWKSRYERFQLELWLVQGRLRAAVEWCDAGVEEPDATSQEIEVARLATARVMIVKGNEADISQAIDLLNQILKKAEEQGREPLVIEALALRSLARYVTNQLTMALQDIEAALRLAEPEGYVRLFVSLGATMARLLQEADVRQVMPDYVDRLLGVYGSEHGPVALHEVELYDPLTEREQEVLRLLASGLTNPEIADLLVISTETVKKHASHIYGKLGVTNRTEAATRARELNLLAS